MQEQLEQLPSEVLGLITEKRDPTSILSLACTRTFFRNHPELTQFHS